MINLQITNINVRYADNVQQEVNIHFIANDSEYAINLSGYIPITQSEYQENQDVEDLMKLVRNKLALKLGVVEEEK